MLKVKYSAPYINLELETLHPAVWENNDGPKDWFAISNENGIFAYVKDEETANTIVMALRKNG